MSTIYKKTILILGCVGLVLCTSKNPVNAEWDSKVGTNGILTVDGTEMENGIPINIYIVDSTGKKIAVKQQKADGDNTCEFSFDLEQIAEKSGEYTAKVIAVNGSAYSVEFTYCLSRDIEGLVSGSGEAKGINTAKALGESEVANVLSDNAELLSYLNPAAAKMVEHKAFDEAAKALMTEDVTVSNIREVMTRTSAIAVFPYEDISGKSELLKNYSDEIGTDNIKEYDTLDEKLFSQMVTRLNTSNKKYTNAEEFYNGVYKAIVLSKLDFAYGNDSIQSILSSHTDLFDLTVFNASDNNKSSMLKKLGKAFENNEIKSVSDVQSVLNNKIKKDSSSTSTGGSSGGGGGFKGGSITSLTPPTEEERSQTNAYIETAFNDIKGYEWAKTGIDGLVKLGVLNGYSNTEFKPYNSITRAEFCKVIAKLIGTAEDMSSCDFADVDSSEWYYGYVNALYKRGIVRGIDSASFEPNSFISRGDAAVILCRALNIAENAETNNSDKLFADDDDIADYARNAVYSLKTLGIVSGDEEGKFSPDSNILRAETAKLVWNAYSYTEGEDIGE